MSIICIKKIISYISFGLLATSVVQGSSSESVKVSVLTPEDSAILGRNGIFIDGHMNENASRENFDSAFFACFREYEKNPLSEGGQDLLEWLWDRSHQNLDIIRDEEQTMGDYIAKVTSPEDQRKWEKMLEYLQRNSELGSALREAVKVGNFEKVKSLLEDKGVDVNSRDPGSGETALDLAERFIFQGMIDYLLSRGAKKHS
ncbi:MAG: ankyrin repeat domain-containing protein [Puniceicoccales bacterium]|jgi:hypothetical protein|nr:ankyrin repeat domain-containing protein [Puniceicoccales bacterium]